MNVKRIKFVIAGVVLVSAFLFLFFSSFQNKNLAYFLTVDEIASQGQSLKGRGIRVEGKIVPKTLVRNREQMNLAFRMQGENSTIPVKYTGVPPDLLENGFPVIAEGKLNEHGVLVAKNLMVACPSRFEEMQKAGEPVPDAATHDAMVEQANKAQRPITN